MDGWIMFVLHKEEHDVRKNCHLLSWTMDAIIALVEIFNGTGQRHTIDIRGKYKVHKSNLPVSQSLFPRPAA